MCIKTKILSKPFDNYPYIKHPNKNNAYDTIKLNSIKDRVNRIENIVLFMKMCVISMITLILATVTMLTLPTTIILALITSLVLLAMLFFKKERNTLKAEIDNDQKKLQTEFTIAETRNNFIELYNNKIHLSIPDLSDAIEFYKTYYNNINSNPANIEKFIKLYKDLSLVMTIYTDHNIKKINDYIKESSNQTLLLTALEKLEELETVKELEARDKIKQLANLKEFANLVASEELDDNQISLQTQNTEDINMLLTDFYLSSDKRQKSLFIILHSIISSKTIITQNVNI